VREACKGDFTSYFRLDVGTVVKNEFCLLCNYPDSLDNLRNCYHESRDSLADSSQFEMKMLLNMKDTLPDQDDNVHERIACTSLNDVSRQTQRPIKHYTLLDFLTSTPHSI